MTALLALVATTASVSPVFAAPKVPAGTAEHEIFNDAITSRCIPPAAIDIVRSYGMEIRNAPTVDEARSLILGQTGIARKALSAASWLMPFSPSVREARQKIEYFENRVYAANTQGEVASDFLDFLAVPEDADQYEALGRPEHELEPMLLAQSNLDSSAVRIGTGSGGCDYTTGEIIIIILGFIFFIIPGIIFLIIFC